MCAAADLYPEEVYADLEKLYEDEALEPYIIPLDEVKDTLRMSQEDALRRKSEQESYHYINDIHAEMLREIG